MRVVLVLALLSAVARAQNDPQRDAIERARELEARLAYDEALVVIESAIAAGQSDIDRIVELHMIAGRLNAGLDKAAAAEQHFAIALAIRPETTLPDDTSPKIAVPFTVARTKVTALVARFLETKDTVTILGSSMIVGIAVRFRTPAGETTRIARDAPVVARPHGSEILEVRGLDRHGNTLWIDAPVSRPIVTQPPPPPDPPFIQRWSTWAVATGVVLGVGGFAAWRFDSAQNEFDKKRDEGMTDFTDLQAIERRGKRWSLVANISFGVAAATAVTSIIFFVRRPQKHDVVVTAGPDGIGVAGSF